MTILQLDSRNVFGTTGSGNQKKQWIGPKLIKLNSKFHEASKEVSASILGKSFGLPIVHYVKSEYLYKGKKYVGCECDTFLKTNEISISLYQIILAENVIVTNNMSSMDYFNNVVIAIYNYTNGGLSVKNIQDYLLKILVFDFIICNEDRHLTNIEFIYDEHTKKWRFAPIYDNGQSFLGRDGGLTKLQIETKLRKFKTKTFSTNPYKNLIDINVAKNIALEFKRNLDSKYGSIDNLPINEFHKTLVKMQMERLLNKRT